MKDKRYTISIETNTASEAVGLGYSNKTNALNAASNYRRGFYLMTVDAYNANENARISVYDNRLQKEVYNKPICKKVLKK